MELKSYRQTSAYTGTHIKNYEKGSTPVSINNFKHLIMTILVETYM
jgi:hypothetical protein